MLITNLFNTFKVLSIWNSILSFAFIILFIVILVFQLLKGRSKLASRQPGDPEALKLVVKYLGGAKNILSIEKDGNRTKVMVKDIEKCQLENLKAGGVTNLFVTGNKIKMICPFDVDGLNDLISQNTEE